MAILIVSEKPAVAKALLPVVGADNRKNGYFEGGGYIVSWCIGHLVHLKFPDDYGGAWAEKPWTFAMLPMIPEQWQFIVKQDCVQQYQVLRTLMNRPDVDEIICATDADREGECIFRYVYALTGCKKPVKRLWVSSLEENALRQGFAHLKDWREYDALFAAGFCRAKADWLIGMNGSRLFSVRYRQKLSLGRVQTPTLAMIVQRDYDVSHFVKKQFFTVDLDCGGFTAVSERLEQENRALELCADVMGKPAVITDISRENKVTNPPKLFDLTTLQRECNKLFGYTAQQTLDTVQVLYEAKLTTYPRTDSAYLPDDMEQTALSAISAVQGVFPELVSPSPDIRHCINNAKVTGHHAIIPTERIRGADLSWLSEVQNNVLYLIAARLVMSSGAPFLYEATKITVRCADTNFTATGRTVKDHGWKSIETACRNALQCKETEQEQMQTIPAVVQGQQIPSVSGTVQEHWTSPPKHFTEDTLLTAMEHAGQDAYDEDTEKKGLGTPATRAAVIEGLVKHGYIERKNKHILATEKGVHLIEVVPDTVKSPQLTAEWEMQLQQIERGKMAPDDFMQGITSYVRRICATYGTRDESSAFQREVTPIGKCPHCGGDVLNGKYGFYCTKKCGMYLGKVFGNALTEVQLKTLLSGKQTSFMRDGKTTIVLPEVEKHEYMGKTSYQWKTRKA